MGFVCFCREQNSTKAEQVFAEVTKAIREYPVDFRGAQILTGNEEGSFGWITVNYLLDTLIKVRARGGGTGGLGGCIVCVSSCLRKDQISLFPQGSEMSF